ncbi:MAG: MarR family winged helix-turn-helix transcriptional regulator [Candidatus Dormibacteria bacterium]
MTKHPPAIKLDSNRPSNSLGGVPQSPEGLTKGSTAAARPPVDLEDSLTAIVGWASRNDVQAEVMRRARCSLPFSHVWLLVRVAATGPCHPSDLATFSGVDNSTITPKLQRLEVEDLLVRCPDPDDRRAALVHVSPTGTRLLKRIRRARAQIVTEAMAELPPSRRQLLEDTVGELARVLDRPVGRSTPG